MTNTENEELLAFSLKLNTLILNFEKAHNIHIMVSCHGYRQYPDQYPGQEKIQLFNIVKPLENVRD